MTARRVASIGLVAAYAALLTGVLWIRERDLQQAVLGAVLLTSIVIVIRRVAAAVVTRSESRATAEGRLDVSVRSVDGHPRLSRAWRRAEIRPSGGLIRVSPFAGPSAAPFTVHATRLRDTGITPGWRDLLRGPVRVSITIVDVEDERGTIEIAVPTAHLSWLMSAVSSPDR